MIAAPFGEVAQLAFRGSRGHELLPGRLGGRLPAGYVLLLAITLG
jgi:hypothetical protein